MSILTPLQNPFRVHLSADAAKSLGQPTPDAAAPVQVRASALPLVEQFDAAKTMAGMLLAAVVAALLVVADQLIETWADGHLLVVWVALWAVAFAALALLQPQLRQVSMRLAAWLAIRSAKRAQRRAEEQVWSVAQQDYRVMTELRIAAMRDDGGN